MRQNPQLSGLLLKTSTNEQFKQMLIYEKVVVVPDSPLTTPSDCLV